MLENKGTGIVCFICGKNNHKAKYCPDKKLRGKYRRERLSKLIESNSKSKLENIVNESPSISSIEIPKETYRKSKKNPFDESKGKIKEIYKKIIELSYVSNGLANEIYKYVDSIYWLKHFNELNNNNKNIYKNDYANKVIKEKINKIAFNYDKANGFDNNEYKSFDEANAKVEMFKEEIEKQALKAKIDLIKEATKVQIKNELCKGLKSHEVIRSVGRFSTKVKEYLMQDEDGEWGRISEKDYLFEINRRVLNSLMGKFECDLNNKRKELGYEIIDNNLNLKKLEKRKENEKLNESKRIKIEKNRLLQQEIDEKRKKEEEDRKNKVMQENNKKCEVEDKFRSYLNKKKLFSKSLFGSPKLLKSFSEIYSDFKSELTQEQKGKYIKELESIFNCELTTRISRNQL